MTRPIGWTVESYLHALLSWGVARTPLACLSIEVRAGIAGYVLGAIVVARPASHELVVRVIDAVRSQA